MENQKVWLPDPVEGYVLGIIEDINQDFVTAKTIRHPQKTIQSAYASTFPCEKDDRKDVNDNCALMFLNEATLLHNLRVRYEHDKIYTYVANILIAINPYFDIRNLYSSDVIKSYQGKSLGVLPPHVFAIADKAFRDMRAFKLSQSVIVSGESGAGKTESTKYVLRYLCESWGSQLGQIEKLILDANPLLEAFGNAKTVRNRNSSRFGKFIEIHFSGKFSVVGGFISHYLLEQSRICGQGFGERNYHIFYQLCAGLASDTWRQLGLQTPDHFHYLNQGCTQFLGSKKNDSLIPAERKSADHKSQGILVDAIVDDLADFKVMDAALTNFGILGEEKANVYKIVAAVLHLGNVSFEESPDDKKGGCRIQEGVSAESSKLASSLIGVDANELNQCLLTRIMQTNKGGHKGTAYLVPLKVREAQNARDALAKAIYSKLFDHLVTRVVNKSIPFSQSAYYIGVLDIAGFEYFRTNSFEQFCINYCNEKLQQFFNERILKEEQSIYAKEGLGLKHIEFVDNQDCIDLLEMKAIGIFDLLDEEIKLPKPSANHFTEAVHATHSGHFRIDVARKSKLKDHREIRDDEGFLIKHFAGAVCYQTSAFIDKNSDALHASLECLMNDARNPLVKNLFMKSYSSSGSSNQSSLSVTFSTSSASKAGKLSFTSVGSRFRSQLTDLMTKLRSTGTHFIRCIKPNLDLVAGKFEGSHILSQLRCSGMGSVLELMQQGYPSRTSFSDLYNMYRSLLPPDLARLDARTFCRALFKALGLNEADFKFGSTRIFFRPGKFAEFDQIMQSDPAHLAQLIGKVQAWLLISRWKKMQWAALCVVRLKNRIEQRREFVIRLQANARAYLCKKRFRHRIIALSRIRKLEKHLISIQSLVQEISRKEARDREASAADALVADIRTLSGRIRREEESGSLSESEIKSLIDSLDHRISETIKRLRGAIQEEKKLQQLEQELKKEEERKRIEAEKRRQDEELRKRKADLEAKFLIENSAPAVTHSSPTNASSRSAAEMDDRFRKEAVSAAQQETLDHELAIRIARENGSCDQVSPVLLPKSLTAPMTKGLNSKYEYLTKWKYSELRDTINTSCDIDLLEACKAEFHRRLKVYHEWKAKNAKNSNNSNNNNGMFDPLDPNHESDRAPACIMQNSLGSSGMSNRLIGSSGNNATPGGLNGSSKVTESRFFRIPFVRPSLISGQKGWWFAHFEGQWIARQMELHPEKPPILLVAGKDDMQMCELSLEETRLTTKRGAEILPEEFESEWTRHGGSAWTRNRSQQRR